jgi:hypothetical protein
VNRLILGSRVGEEGKGVFIAVTVTVGVAFCLLDLLFALMTAKSSSSVMSSMFGGSAGTTEGDEGFCAPSLAALVHVCSHSDVLITGRACHRGD